MNTARCLWPALTMTIAAASAEAAPLSLAQIEQFTVAISCRESCANLGGSTVACVSECPPLDQAWARDGEATPPDQHDLQLAILEYMNAAETPPAAEPCGGTPEQPLAYCTDTSDLCYADAAMQVVLAPAMCPSAECQADPQLAFCPRSCASAAPGDPACSDADGDGLSSWLETAISTSDTEGDVPCAGNRDCNGFTQECKTFPALANNLCVDRDCVSAGGCTAFHLQVVDKNAQEVLVHVHYDYSPYPATVLDLKVVFDAAALQLVDARPLPPLRAPHLELERTLLTNGTLRLTVIDSQPTDPIPTGGLIELLFRRRTATNTRVRFSTDPYDRQHSIAPLQGTHQTELAADGLWGSDVELGAVPAQQGDRLLLSYDFASSEHPIGYEDTPTADAICGVFSECSVAGAAPNARVLTRLSVLQRGFVLGGQPIDGVVGKGLYLNGNSDHLRTPLSPTKIPTLTQPATPADQSYSLSFWFYAEGYSVNEDSSKGQYLYSDIDEYEQVHSGLLLRQGTDADHINLYSTRSVEGTPSERVLAADLPTLKWHHLAHTVDAAQNVERWYINGQLFAEGGVNEFAISGLPVACPKLNNGRELQPHLEGDIISGKGPQYLYHAAAQNGLYGIERLDLNGFVTQALLRSPEYNNRDPDYNQEHDLLVYSSDATGGFEVWVAKGDGSDARQLTAGFGDTAREIAARRPRWDPNGKGIVFSSNVYSAGDNAARVAHLYYVGLERLQAVAQGDTSSRLDYGAELVSGRIKDVRLTTADSQHVKASWVRGPGASDRGELLISQSDANYRNQTIRRLVINNVGPSSITAVETLAGESDELDLLDVDRPTQGRPSALILLRKDALLAVANASGTANDVSNLASLATFVDRIDEAVFTRNQAGVPDGVIVSGNKRARATLLWVPYNAATRVLTSAQAVRISDSSSPMEGLRWKEEEAYSACNWLGAHRDPYSGRMVNGFRGGLDEVKIYSYVRPPAALTAEVERGREQLQLAGHAGALAPTLVDCQTQSDCPPFHICDANDQCVVQLCDPNQSQPCSVGLCTLLPEAVEQEVASSIPGVQGKWACNVECSLDAACFTKQCANGPCRYCDPTTSSCGECRPPEEGEPFATVVGCPDSNRWTCSNGACVSECFVKAGDNYFYACDLMTESCRQGTCQLENWNWQHLAPATFSGLGLPHATYRAIPETYPIEVQAFGAGDYLQTPEIIVEGSTGDVWFTVGRIVVDNHTEREAAERPYILTHHAPLMKLRLRLYAPWSQNIVKATCEATGGTDCAYRSAVSKSQLGYRVEIPRHLIAAACQQAGGPNCLPAQADVLERYLRNDASTVIVRDVIVNGNAINWASDSTINRICPYLNETDGVLSTEPEGRLIWGGNLMQDGSNASARYCGTPRRPSKCPDTNRALTLPNPLTFGVLNCDFSNGVEAETPALELAVTSLPGGFPAQYGDITETQNACTVEIASGTRPRTEHCYEWLNDPALDPFSAESQNHNDFEYSLFRSFGY